MTDCFDSKACSAKIAIKQNDITAIEHTWCGATIFLSNVAKTGVHRWRFLLKKASGYAIYIGIWKTKHKLVTDGYLTDEGKCYSYCATHARLMEDDNDTYGDRRCKQGDKIDILLDLNKLELRYFVNGKDFGVAYKVEKTEYRAAVSLFGKGDNVELLSYKQESDVVNVCNDDDVKCNKCNEFKKEIVSLKKNHSSAISDNESIINAMQQRIGKLEAEKQELEEKCEDSNAEYKELQKKYDDSNAECKELQMELKTVSTKYNALYRKTNIDTKNYLNWDSDTITDWIITLNAEYEAYEDKLRMKMKEEGVEGSLLSELDRNDLHRFGVIMLKHKVQILKHIKALMQQNNPQNAVIASADGDYGTPYI